MNHFWCNTLKCAVKQGDGDIAILYQLLLPHIYSHTFHWSDYPWISHLVSHFPLSRPQTASVKSSIASHLLQSLTQTTSVDTSKICNLPPKPVVEHFISEVLGNQKTTTKCKDQGRSGRKHTMRRDFYHSTTAEDFITYFKRPTDVDYFVTQLA